MARLLLVRHGITEHNTTRQFAGHNDDGLNAAGYRQVELLHDRLVSEQIDEVYCSDLKRAMVTAEVICSGHNVEILTCSELREINYGDAEGLTLKEISERYPDLAQSITNFNLEMCFPGGESFKEFIERTVEFLGKLRKQLEMQTILIVSHVGVLKVLVCDLLGISQNHWPQIRFDNASLSIVDVSPRRVMLSLLNDTSHLKGANPP